MSVAPMLAARRAHVPIVLHEPNAIPGLANRLLARSATSVAIAFEDARSRIPGRARIETIGYPVRTTILDVPAHRAALAEEARSLLGLEPERRTVMVTGGSQGALHLDQVVAAALPSFAERGDLQLLIVTGPDASPNSRARLSALASLASSWCRSSIGWSSDMPPPIWSWRGRAPRPSRSSRSAGCRRSWCRTRTRPRTIRTRTRASWCASVPRCWCPTPSSRRTSSRRPCWRSWTMPSGAGVDGRAGERVGEARCRGAVRVPGGGSRPQ